MENYIEDSRIHEGHRQRMRSKLLTHGQRIFDTYELLEMLLYHVIPYKDTNPIAKRLLAAFGGLDGVLSAERDELTAVSGVGERTADFLLSVGELSYILGAEFMPRDADDFSDYKKAGEYFVNYFKNETEPSVVGLLLDNNMRLIEAKKIYLLEYSSGGVRPKAFIDAALSARASVMITAHNHLYGPACPTQGDRATNEIISESLALAGILHAEHYVICGDSYSGVGAVKDFTRRLLQPSLAESFIKSIPSDARVDRVPDGQDTLSDVRYNTRHFDYFASLLAAAEGKKARETAHLLLSKFLTIENIFCASETELISAFSERLAFFIKLLAYVTSRRETDEFAFGKMYTRAEIADYLKALFIGESVEKVYLLTFDGQGRLTGCELLGEGTVNSSEVIPRKAIETALKKAARSVAMAHNHPLGKAEPSSEDMKFNNSFSSLFGACDISFTTHYVVAGQLCKAVAVGFMNLDE